MSNLFDKALIFTDLHFGKKNNDRQHNKDCEDFCDWLCKLGKEKNCETAIFMGDWHDNRRSLNISTMNYSLRNLEKVADAFQYFYFITGNHDIYYRDRRDIHSIEIAKNIEKITIVNEEPLIKGNCALVPWLVGDEHKKLSSMDVKYMFSHLELGGFLMNAMVEMPETKLKASDLKKPEYVFTGHFHKRQNKGNIWYTGNCFPHDFSDVWDDERGAMFLEWDKEPVFYTWPNQPVYRTFNLSTLVEDPGKYLNDKVCARITIDVDLSFEESQELKETLEKDYGVRKLSFVPVKNVQEQEWEGDIEFLSVDQIVSDGINQVESVNIDKDLLLNIYHSLEKKEN